MFSVIALKEKPAASLRWQRDSRIVFALFRPIFSAQERRSPARHQRGGGANKNGGRRLIS
jgi:hypothetical protein